MRTYFIDPALSYMTRQEPWEPEVDSMRSVVVPLEMRVVLALWTRREPDISRVDIGVVVPMPTFWLAKCMLS